MSHKDLKQLSKFLSYLLRHGAEEYDLTLDEHGFADLETVWKIVENRYKRRFQREDLVPILAGELDGKQRLAVEGQKIRAVYGHNRKISTVVYEPADPPDILYHGTNARAVPSIREAGLLPMERQYVHLSVDRERAYSVARRTTSDPVMLEIRAKDAQQAGCIFYQPDSQHFLCEAVPAAFLVFPP